MIRSTVLPLLPGYSYNTNLGRTRFNKSQFFEHNKNIGILSEKLKPGIGGDPLPGSQANKYPSAYARCEVSELPAWLAFDKQVLAFDAFFQETAQERCDYAFQIRPCKIYFFLEDGTTQVTENNIRNSGIKGGTLISRQRIPFPPPRNADFYDLLDYNVGREVELYGKVFKITSCDNFTRTFLNRSGISVPDPINTPADPYMKIREKMANECMPRKPNRSVPTFKQFLEFDRKVLNFGGYWDDRENVGGFLHQLAVRYYLADDTMEVIEDIPPNSGRDYGCTFLGRCKMPKVFHALPSVGADSSHTVLNVLPSGFLKGRYIIDALNCGRQDTDFYTDGDLCIGGVVNVFGRKVVLTDCDGFTREYYRVKYGLDDFQPYVRPLTALEIEEATPPKFDLPPWNGYGTYEDSAANCKRILPQAPKGDFVKFLENDRVGIDSHILRYKAELLSKVKDDELRDFVLSYHLTDDTIDIYEQERRNSGFQRRSFYSQNRMYKPGQDLYADDHPPLFYGLDDLYVGNVLEINGFRFRLVDADEYAYRYMETKPKQFPKSDIKLIMDKIQAAIKPVSKEFVAQYWPNVSDPCLPLPYCDLRKSLFALLGSNITEHEVITVGRYYNTKTHQDKYPKDKLRQIVHTELRRELFDAFERLQETFRHKDAARSGHVSRAHAYCVLRGAALPLDKDLIEAVLDKVCTNADGELSYCDLLRFLDYKHCPAPCLEPLNVKQAFGAGAFRVDNMPCMVDIQYVVRDLGLEEGPGKTDQDRGHEQGTGRAN